jgi:GH35 family endo-1,4-beta-xylanase
VPIRIEQLRHDFLFGCNLFNFGHCANPEQEEVYRQRFAALLNYCTLAFYWATYEPRRGQPDFPYTDQVLEWTRANGIIPKGHPLVWDHPAGSPEWLPNDPTQIQQLSDARVNQLVSRYQGRINIWDVVNEATHLPEHVNKTKVADWGATLGSNRYTMQALRIARAANRQAQLVVNDYRTDQPYYDLLKNLQVNGKFLYDITGIQSHMHDGLWPLQKAWDISDNYGRLNRALHFTESTVLSGPRTGPGENWGSTTPDGEAKQADYTASFYTMLFAHPAIHAITWWDFSDYRAWQRAPAGWLREDMSPKPVYHRLMDLIKHQWWTNLSGETGPRGNFVTRGFYGTYRITVEPPNRPPLTRTVHWQRGQANVFAFRI